MKPLEGAKKEGVKGFLKGAWKGVSGLIVKPLTGVLDAASKTSEGIKNTATRDDEKPNQNRERFPRPFYGIEQFYRTYLATDAEIVYLLQIYNKGEFSNISLLYTFDIFPNPSDKEEYFVLVLSVETVLLWSAKNAEIAWDFPSRDLSKAIPRVEGVTIHLKKSLKTTNVKLILDARELLYSIGKNTEH